MSDPSDVVVALSLDRLGGVEAVDTAAGTLTARAGTTLEAVQQAASDAGFRYPVDFGARGSCQIGDSNLHLTVAGNSLADESPAMHHDIVATVYELVGQWHGSISGEHGIGLLKRDFLHYNVTPEVLTAMRTLKAAFIRGAF